MGGFLCQLLINGQELTESLCGEFEVVIFVLRLCYNCQASPFKDKRGERIIAPVIPRARAVTVRVQSKLFAALASVAWKG